ncbi:MAG: hypothetical protein NT069_16105 [Planctomycetota bacterium]|nr:hypothetical protein [Planctomycetota bacterium]
MWNRSYRWQRLARGFAGGLTLICAVGAAAWGSRTPAARHAGASVQELAGVGEWGTPRKLTALVPVTLGVAPGHLVHRARPDGAAQIVGRVTAVGEEADGLVAIEFSVSAEMFATLDHGAILSGAPATMGLEQSLRLVISPEAPREEAMRARDALWPSVEKEIIPGLTENLLREVRELFTHLSDDDRELVLGALDELRTDLAPLEENLIARLSERAWSEIGVGGVAGGIWRIALGGVNNKRKDMRDWFRTRMGFGGIADRQHVEFLERETREALRQAMVEELQAFWEEHRGDILRQVEAVLGTRKAGFATIVRERWAPTLFDRAVAPAWLAGEDKVLHAVEDYARDFANRRLVSSAGGPRLVFAHALRGVLEISDSPLLLLAPRESGDAEGVEYQPVVP